MLPSTETLVIGTGLSLGFSRLVLFLSLWQRLSSSGVIIHKSLRKESVPSNVMDGTDGSSSVETSHDDPSSVVN